MKCVMQFHTNLHSLHMNIYIRSLYMNIYIYIYSHTMNVDL